MRTESKHDVVSARRSGRRHNDDVMGISFTQKEDNRMVGESPVAEDRRLGLLRIPEAHINLSLLARRGNEPIQSDVELALIGRIGVY